MGAVTRGLIHLQETPEGPGRHMVLLPDTADWARVGTPVLVIRDPAVTDTRHPYIEGKRSRCCTHPGCTDVYDLDGTHPQEGDPDYPAPAATSKQATARLADDMAAAIRELHDPDPRGYCVACGWKSPCATRQMVDGFVPPGEVAAHHACQQEGT
jgi:hypothetical protein